LNLRPPGYETDFRRSCSGEIGIVACWSGIGRGRLTWAKVWQQAFGLRNGPYRRGTHARRARPLLKERSSKLEQWLGALSDEPLGERLSSHAHKRDVSGLVRYFANFGPFGRPASRGAHSYMRRELVDSDTRFCGLCTPRL
jgi:hypothetical protein